MCRWSRNRGDATGAGLGQCYRCSSYWQDCLLAPFRCAATRDVQRAYSMHAATQCLEVRVREQTASLSGNALEVGIPEDEVHHSDNGALVSTVREHSSTAAQAG